MAKHMANIHHQYQHHHSSSSSSSSSSVICSLNNNNNNNHDDDDDDNKNNNRSTAPAASENIIYDLVTVDQFENVALPLLPKTAEDYYQSGADEEITLRENRLAFDRFHIIPRVMMMTNANTNSFNLQVTFLNDTYSLPIGLAPFALHKMAHRDGETATVRAASAHGIPMILSTLSSTSIETVAEHGGGPNKAMLWQQLYIYKDRQRTIRLVRRAEAAGYRALVHTVDAPVFGQRISDCRNRFNLPPGLELPNFEELPPASSSSCYSSYDNNNNNNNELSDGSAVRENGLFAKVGEYLDSATNWESFDWLCSITRLPVIIKGIMSPEDADTAIKHGAAAVFVSNHGGRQLDSVPATIEVLPRIVEAVAGRVPVLIDSGVRRGSDVLKALALGANMVLFARPYLYGLTVGGQAGVSRIIEIFREELVRAMALSGCSDVTKVAKSVMVLHQDSIEAQL